ncbi:hypothetical protein [Bifidobacterium mongoliense]|uniref:ABC transporter permease n=2 Tax=Bifidobacterium mongoliense TaxID=518643 RepID=A0A087BS81_9BIFI|nr:hypothetical protein [Bifidobacterium mongoliense]KFI73881.1 ABC transporter permease [Bifidobacterium mongoliense DSM 21395]MDN6016810.1 hypothetical protein [Bifidobacterium mongoliense]MDN6553508.1 hypothetical protein [Bifidobacterium mongoliense]ROT86386.1 hypothetical protein BMONG18_1533 [Bifidobacterium mongoliense]
MKNFFKGISFSQIGAGALAAVTSFLLSARIGLAGSVIGVAIGSIVSAISSQIYQNVLKASSKKIQAATPFMDSGQTGSGAPAHTGGDTGARIAGAAGEERSVGDTSVMPSVGEGIGETTAVKAAPVDGAPAVGEGNAPRVVASDGTIDPDAVVHQGVRIDEDGAAHVKAPEIDTTSPEARKRKKIALIISIVSALVAVLITALVITLATRGKGTDSVVRDWASTSVRRPAPSRTPSTDVPSTPSTTAPSSSPSAGSGSSQGSENSGNTSGDTGSTNGSGNGSGTSGGSGTTNGSGSGTDSNSKGTDSHSDTTGGGSGTSGSGQGSDSSQGSGSGSVDDGSGTGSRKSNDGTSGSGGGTGDSGSSTGQGSGASGSDGQ